VEDHTARVVVENAALALARRAGESIHNLKHLHISSEEWGSSALKVKGVVVLGGRGCNPLCHARPLAVVTESDTGGEFVLVGSPRSRRSILMYSAL
jgi:hypothetical protein